ncbi:hypothetical protein ACF3M1_10795 [Luteimonas sp. WGS1318]|uniref:hypothetical protein n=1 Tax=Luteimonas sp. WGS1318 TaxID=3366815 RepID=UPI00372D74BC
MTDLSPQDQAPAEAVAPPPPPVTYDRPPVTLDDVQQPPERPAPVVLPPLPRSISLRATDGHAAEIAREAGPLAPTEPAISSTIAAQRAMSEGLQALEQARQNRDPRKTPAEHLDAVRAAYDRLMRDAARRHDGALASIEARERTLEREISDRIGSNTSPDAAEIRQALRSMTIDERRLAIGRAIESGDQAVIAAVLSGRQMTTGVTPEEQAHYRMRAENRLAPDLAALRRGLARSRALVKSAFDDLFQLDGKIIGSPEVGEEFKRQAQAADEAWLALSRKLES